MRPRRAPSPARCHGCAPSRQGLTPAEALRAATRNGAQAIGVLGSRGTIEVGKLADLVVLRADPLRDIRNTRSVELVVKHGRIYRRDAATAAHPLAQLPAPPVAPVRPVTDPAFGTVVTDRYRWMERDTAEFNTWLRAQGGMRAQRWTRSRVATSCCGA